MQITLLAYLRAACSTNLIRREKAKWQLHAGHFGSIVLSTDPAGAGAARPRTNSHQIIIVIF